MQNKRLISCKILVSAVEMCKADCNHCEFASIGKLSDD